MSESNVATKSCTCLGHGIPGIINHSVPCCDKPHITEEEYLEALEFKKAVMRIVFGSTDET